jgi:hypothetical protein
MKRLILITMAMATFGSSGLLAAVGCDLNDPDRDVKRLFPESTGYKTVYVSIDKKGGDALLREIESRLGDGFKGLYETIDVPYTMYRIYKGSEIVGYIHGVNQKGHYGGIQVFLALDLEGTIKAFYVQKLTSKGAKAFRGEAFGREFQGLSLKDFYRYDVVSGKETPPGKIGAIKNPAPDSPDDFAVIMRAVKKNLILVDEFLLDNKHLQYFKSAEGRKP